MSALDLDALFAPIGARAFFADYYEQSPLHLSGDHHRCEALLDHATLFDALARAAEPPDGLVVFPEHAGIEGGAAALLGDRDRLRAYVNEGHPIVWNRARGVFPAIDALAAGIARAFGAHVWPNVYATGYAGTPFDAHFDAHEVIAIQLEGRKTWWISEVRIDRPLDAVEMEAAVAAALRARRDDALARTLATFTAAPGDLVYIPRGQFHNAKAEGERTTGNRSLHVTFGIRTPSGFDVAQHLAKVMLADPIFREYLPPAAADVDGARARALLGEVTTKMLATIEAAAEDVRAAWVRRS